MKVCVGGTFDVLHKGHRALLDKAFEIAGKDGMVYIGISSDSMARKKDDLVSDYERRKGEVIAYLKERGYTNYKIVPIHDKYGLTLDENFDVIVVSEETFDTAREINMIRKRKGLKEIKIEKIPLVMAEDGKPISSTRIRKGEINREGRILG
ncbi:MAG: cytidyltransferase [Thermoplasmata archaeon]|nr:MAG: cytidyltransferase [Thermoplasmata archaeon]